MVLGTAGASVWEFPQASPYGKIGDGSPGTAGFVPRHYGDGGVPQVGNGSWGLVCDQIRGGATTVLLIGTSEISLPIFGGNLYVGGLVAVPAGNASGAPGAGGQGEVFVPLPIPSSSSLAGATLVSQYAVIDPGAGHPSGVTLSDGLRTTTIL